jgi:circadian clock protein KaiC
MLGMDLTPHLQNRLIFLRQIDTAEMGPGEFAHMAKGMVEQGVRLLVMDSLNGYLSAMPEQKLLTAQLHELLSFFAQKGVSTLLIIGQEGLFGQIRSPVDVSYLSDTVVLLRYFEAAGRVRKAISVVKKRLGPHENSIRELSVGKGGLQVGEPLLQFSGILSGGPQYFGETPALSDRI